MSTIIDTPVTSSAADAGTRITRVSARIGLVFTVCQLTVMVAMTTLVLPNGGSLTKGPLEWGNDVLAAATWYRIGNYAFVLAGTLLVGFLGAVFVKLRQADRSGALAAIGVGAGTLLAFVWPFAAVLHDVAINAAAQGTDVRLLAGWDAVAPYSLAFSALPRIFLVGAIVVGLRLAGEAPWLQRIGAVILPLSLVGPRDRRGVPDPRPQLARLRGVAGRRGVALAAVDAQSCITGATLGVGGGRPRAGPVAGRSGLLEGGAQRRERASRLGEVGRGEGVARQVVHRCAERRPGGRQHMLTLLGQHEHRRSAVGRMGLAAAVAALLEPVDGLARGADRDVDVRHDVGHPAVGHVRDEPEDLQAPDAQAAVRLLDTGVDEVVEARLGSDEVDEERGGIDHRQTAFLGIRFVGI
jgi:hypothetical protein